jgi:hypothetical protein
MASVVGAITAVEERVVVDAIGDGAKATVEPQANAETRSDRTFMVWFI